MSEDGGQCTSNIMRYFGTESLSAPLSIVLLPLSGASIQVPMKKETLSLNKTKIMVLFQTEILGSCWRC